MYISENSFLIPSLFALLNSFHFLVYLFVITLHKILNVMTQWSLLPRGLRYSISAMLSSSFDKIRSKMFVLVVPRPLVGFETC